MQRFRQAARYLLPAGFLFFLIKGIVWLVIGGFALFGVMK